AAHLVYWGVAKVIEAITMYNVYQVSPAATNVHSQSATALEFRRKFTFMELSEVLATFNGKSRLSAFMTTLNPQRKLEYVHMLIWLLQHEYVSQMHRYVYLMIPDPEEGNNDVHLPPPVPLSPLLPPTYSPQSSEPAATEKEFLAQLARRTNTPTPVVDLFRRLEPYFHGQHHLVEIMWRENVTRGELRTVLSTYMHILAFADHE
ncbi:hypothetical protein AaE_009273, partial [Aphanomyces astaci]